MIDVAALDPWHGALFALAVALALALGAGAFGRPWLGPLAAGIGVFGGWWLMLGLVTATPRQLFERLPLAALGAILFVALTQGPAQRWPRLRALLLAAAAAALGWWMAGAPVHGADAWRALPEMALVALGAVALAARGTGRLAPIVAAATLTAGLAGAGAPGPYLLLGVTLLAATLGAAAGRHPPATMLAAVPVAAALAALAAVPVLARGAATDWAAALAPLAALWLGQPIAARLPRWAAPLGPVVAAMPLVAAAFLLR